MQKTAEIRRAIQAGLKYIDGEQLRSGGFKSYSSPHINPFLPERSYGTTFAPSLILSALAGVPGSGPIRGRLASFLRSQASAGWSYNYWSKSEPERKRKPYPDDLDDTFCALAALYLHDPKIMDAKVLAQATKLLLATETKVGGPYRTWLVPADSDPGWLDVDLAVNANVSYFLSLIGSPLPGLQNFMDDRIDKGQVGSPYYPSPHMPLYYISRGYDGKRKDGLIGMAQGLLGSSPEVLETALCLSSLLRLHPDAKVGRTVGKLLGAQNPDGSWPAAAFCMDPTVDGQPYYSGSAALTTALVLEALQLYSQKSSSADSRQGRDDKTIASVLAKAKSRARNLESGLRESMTKELVTVAMGSNGKEIICLPHRFNKSLISPLPRSAGKLLDELALANLFGWLAYTVYDDFLDDEGKPELLPTANAAMRRSLEGFLEAVPDNRGFESLVRRTFDDIDSANAWEQVHCRFEVETGELLVGPLPDYGDMSKLAERSLGHTLAPLGVMAATGLKMDGAQARQITLALRHYLIVRQLNDDAHDWAEDLSCGHITPAVAAVLSDLKLKPVRHAIARLMPKARQQFWHGTLPKMCTIMQSHAKLSREALSRSKLLKNDNVITLLLDNLEVAVDDALATRQQAREFLKHYGGDKP